jgi:signal transduction histidine kinase/ActR/RegA family two-component response regulator
MSTPQAPERCSVDELRTLFLFEKLNDQQLAWLSRAGRIEQMEPGIVFREGEPATCFYILLEGTLVLSRRVGTDDIEVNRTSDRGVYAGAFTVYLGDRVPQTYNGSLHVTEPSRFFVLGADDFARMMRDWFPMAVHLLEGLFFGTQNAQQAIGQRDRLLALGSLSAGLTHELNNPAAAAVRATSALRERVAGMRHHLGAITAGKYSQATLETLIQLQERAVELVAKAPALSPMEASDREDAITEWLDGHGVADGWELAATFVQAGLDAIWLDHIASAVDQTALEGTLRWLNCTVETELLLNEIADSTTRVSALVGAAKQYSQLDRAPYQMVDVHELLDSTLMMLSGKIPPGVTIVKDYTAGLPAIPAYAAELNQVWTNLIDNAVSAMNGTGTLTVRTGLYRDQLFVEFGDTGPGVSPEIRERIFEPFFTTKKVGQGTGLGLSQVFGFAKQSGGEVEVASEVGKGSTFTLYLPRAAGGNRPQQMSAQEASPLDGHGMTVLVVEDNPEVGNFAADALAGLGYTAQLVGNATHALEELAANADRFDVVFSDVVMPGMTGIELAQEIRRRHGDLPVVLTSGYSHVLSERGSTGYGLLQKPYSTEQLARVLNRLGRSRKERRAATTPAES